MRSHYARLLLTVMLVTVIGLVLAACGGGEEPTPVPEVANTAAPPPPTDTPVPPPPTDTPPPPPPTETPVPEVELTPFESAEGGYAIEYPSDWFTSSEGGFTTFASAEELLDSADPGEEGGVALVFSGPTTDFEGTDPAAMMDQLVTEMDLADQAEVVEGPTAVTINGNEGSSVVIRGTSDNGTPISVFVTLLVKGERAAIMVAATPQDSEADFRPVFEKMANTIEVLEPVAAELPESQGVLLFGVTETSSVTEAGPSTWEFIGLEGEVLDIFVEPLADDFDLTFDVLDESGQSVLDIAVDESFGAEELRDFTVPASGSYTISVSGFAGTVGDYKITLAEAGAAVGGAGSINYGDLLTGSLASGESAAWTFTAQARDFVDITVAPYNFDLVVDVLDPGGASLLEEGPVDDSFDTEFIRVLSLLEDGTYTIVITGFEDEFGDYDISLDLSNGGQPGSIVFAADTLEEGETEDGHAFPFTALAGEVVKFYVDPEFGFDVVVEIVNDDTDEVLEEIDATTGFEEAIFNVSEDGNYYFLVKGFEGSFGAYDATLLGSDFVIFELAGGDGVVGQFGSDGIIDYIYRGQAGDTITFTAETNDDLDLMLSMTDLDDNPLLTVDDFVAGGSETLSYTFTEDLIVFLTVSEFNATPGEFYLFVDME